MHTTSTILIAAYFLTFFLVFPANVHPAEKSTQIREFKESNLKNDPPSLFSRHLLGDWGGLQHQLEERGLNVSLYYNHFYGIKAGGGRHPHDAQSHSGSGDLFILADLEKMGLWPGGEIFLQVKNNFGRNINPKVGALSDPFDDADFNEPIYIDQLWFQQAFLDKKIRVRWGYLDLQTILDRNAYANSEDLQFMSTFLDNNAAIIPLKVALGAALLLNPTDCLELAFGVSDADNEILLAGFDTAFDDFKSLMAYGEAGYNVDWQGEQGPLPGKYRLGLFYDPRQKAVFGQTNPTTGLSRYERGDVGFYFSFDQMLYREGPLDSQGLGLFFRYGYREPEVNRISHFWSTGFQYQGPVPGRDKDRIGFAVYSVHASNWYRTRVNSDFSRETGFEWYYNAQLTPCLALSPDLQLIDNPGGLKSARTALVFGLRGRITF